jgi:hypothetical protein
MESDVDWFKLCSTVSFVFIYTAESSDSVIGGF